MQIGIFILSLIALILIVIAIYKTDKAKKEVKNIIKEYENKLKDLMLKNKDLRFENDELSIQLEITERRIVEHSRIIRLFEKAITEIEKEVENQQYNSVENLQSKIKSILMTSKSI